MKQLASVPGVVLPHLEEPHFADFLVDFNSTGRSVSDINAALLEKRIFGGHDLSASMPDLGQCALYSVTEVHTKADIDSLVVAIKEVCR
jgi:glycine dehydrogenase subunit 1